MLGYVEMPNGSGNRITAIEEEPWRCRGDCPACRQGLVPVQHRRLIVEVFSDGTPIACHVREE